MKIFIHLLFFAVLSKVGFSQDFKTEFDQLCEQGDTIKQIELLRNWEKEDPENPELLTSYFNYYFLMAEQEVVALTTEAPNNESLQLTDSAGNTAGYLTSQIVYNELYLQKGFEKIDEGISRYPNRLDMRFGKIFALGKAEDWEGFTDEIIKTVQYSNQNNNEWTWTFNERRENGEQLFLRSIQDYQLTLYNTGDDDLLMNMRKIAEEVLKYYPNNIESLSNLSITYLLTGAYDNGIEVLLKAEKINPKDGIILSNIAHGYKLKKDTENAIKYYEKMLELEDPQAEEFAKQQIEELKKQDYRQ
jgi:tetratricopeptide (TPR) repeat protein